MKNHIQAIRITLLVLIVIGLGLLVTQSFWVPSLVQGIMSHDTTPVLVPTATTTTKSTSTHKAATATPSIYTKAGVELSVFIGPTCPVQTATQQCADKPYETAIVFVDKATGKEAVVARTNTLGRASVDLNPGTYTVHAQSIAALPRLTPVTVTVPVHTRTKLTLTFDSGIR